MFEESFRGVADLVLPGHELPRARRHHRQPRGPAAAPAPRRDRALPGRARLDREARRAVRRRALAARLGASSRRSRRSAYGGISFARGRRAARRCPPRPEAARAPRPPERAQPLARAAGCACSPTGRSSPARRSSGRPSSHFQRPAARSSSPAPTRAPARSPPGDEVTRQLERDSRRLRARIARDLAAGTRPRSPTRPHAGELHEFVEVSTVTHRRALVGVADQGVV